MIITRSNNPIAEATPKQAAAQMQRLLERQQSNSTAFRHSCPEHRLRHSFDARLKVCEQTEMEQMQPWVVLEVASMNDVPVITLTSSISMNKLPSTPHPTARRHSGDLRATPPTALLHPSSPAAAHKPARPDRGINSAARSRLTSIHMPVREHTFRRRRLQPDDEYPHRLFVGAAAEQLHRPALGTIQEESEDGHNELLAA